MLNKLTFTANIGKNCFKVLEVISSSNCKLELKSGVGQIQKRSDLEAVALSLITESMSNDSVYLLFEPVDVSQIPNIIERAKFDKRSRKLFLFLEEIRTKLTLQFLEYKDYFITDSMLLMICKYARDRRIKICKYEFGTAPSK